MKSLPMVVLLAQEGRLANEKDIADKIEEQGYHFEVVRLLDELIFHIQQSDDSAIITVVDALTITTSLQDISGYREFLRRYAKVRRKNVELIVILWPKGEEPSTMVGIGDLVSAYLNAQPKAEKLAYYIQRIATDMEKTLEQ